VDGVTAITGDPQVGSETHQRMDFAFATAFLACVRTGRRNVSAVATIITGRARWRRRDDLAALFHRHLAPRASANDRQPVVVWVADEADPERFHLFEIYSDREAMAANASSDWFRDYLAVAAPLLDGMPSMITGAPRWWKGIDLG
jgi:quinol monooxygenase YgiN